LEGKKKDLAWLKGKVLGILFNPYPDDFVEKDFLGQSK